MHPHPLANLLPAGSLTRRDALGRLGGGLGLAGLATVLADSGFAPASAAASETQAASAGSSAPTAPRGLPHYLPRAKRVIHLFMNGGPFGPDFFDPKPALNQYAGQRPAAVELRTENVTGGLMPVPWKYRRHGQSGLEISDLLPHLARHADDLCVLRSLHTANPNHGPALLMMNSGAIAPTRPSLGSWLLYGLGSENANLPGYVVLCPGRPVRFSILWQSAFLPSAHQGTYINHAQIEPARMIPYLRNAGLDVSQQQRQLELMRAMNQEHLAQRAGDQALEGRMQAMETAFRMQFAATDAFDVRLEPESVREEYGTGHFANGCLLARRLAERGVRFVQVYYGNGQPWDTHRNHNNATEKLALDIDRPLAALLNDLKRRGMLDDTLVVWGGEFGRTPTTESGDGRDHNHFGFAMFLAGGGVRGGMSYGETDEFGFRAVQNKVHVHDLHATLLHLLGIDHERLTYRYAGRDFRLTDVSGRVIQDVLA